MLNDDDVLASVEMYCVESLVQQRVEKICKVTEMGGGEMNFESEIFNTSLHLTEVNDGFCGRTAKIHVSDTSERKLLVCSVWASLFTCCIHSSGYLSYEAF